MHPTVRRVRRNGNLLLRNLDTLVPALIWVSVVRLGLSCSAYNIIRGCFVRRVDGLSSAARASEARRVAWAVRHASRLVPFASCLTQALTCQIMLSRRAIGSTIHVGARRDDSQSFAAHAWLSCNDAILLGGNARSVNAYVTLAEYRT